MNGDFFDALEAELRAAVPRAARRRGGSRSRRWPLRPSAIAIGLSVATTVAVAVAAFVLLGHRHAPLPRPPVTQHRRNPPTTTSGTGSDYSLGAVPTLAQLRANFAVLRRPQTAADRAQNPPCGCGAVDRRLTRLARTLPDGSRVYLIVPRSLADAPIGSVPRSAMQVFVAEPNGNGHSFAFGPNVGYAHSPIDLGGLGLRRPSNSRWVGIVPDGVASARWTVCGSSAGSRCARPRTYTVPVIDNIATQTIPSSGQCVGCRRVEQVDWLARDGTIVGRFDHGYNLGAPPFVAGGHGSRTLQTLTPTGIGSARIGQPIAAATTALTALLGPPADVSVRTGGCGIDTENAWASPATASPLTVYVAHGRFVGYRYGGTWQGLAIAPGPGARLATARGVTLGTSIGTTRNRYPAALQTQPHGSTNWQLTIGTSTLSGQVLPIRYPLHTVTAANQIANIAAGNTGCPSKAP